MATKKLGLRAQSFQAGAAVVRKATTRPLPKLRSTTSGAPLRSRAITRVVEAAGGFQPGWAAKYRSTNTVPRKLFWLAAKMRKMKWLASTSMSGVFSRRSTCNSRGPASGKGNSPSPLW